jgi:hypothetical protein
MLSYNICWTVHVDFKVWRSPWLSSGSVIAVGSKIRGFKPDRIRLIFRATKSTARLPYEEKWSRRSHVITLYDMLHKHTNMKEILSRQNTGAISRKVSLASLLDVPSGNCQRVLANESEITRNQMGRTINQKWSQCKGCLMRPPHNSNNNSKVWKMALVRFFSMYIGFPCQSSVHQCSMLV